MKHKLIIYILALVGLALGIKILLKPSTAPQYGPRDPMAAWMGPVPDTARSQGRSGAAIDRIIFYTSEHTADRAAKLWKDSGAVSGHYIVTESGAVWQFVEDEDTAYHAGNRTYNNASIGIAIEGFADYNNPENRGRLCSWQTLTQRKALVDLTLRLAGKFNIPIDREHLIGKNQVPGISGGVGELVGPEYWGGATNKYAPGPTWNWSAFMEALGVPLHIRTLKSRRTDLIRTLPHQSAPAIATLHQGQKAVSYAETGEYFLIYITGIETEQPKLPAGSYHWDGWIPKSSVAVVDDEKPVRIAGVFPDLQPVYPRIPTDEDKAAWWLPEGKWVAPTNRVKARPDEQIWIEVDMVDPAAPRRGWLLVKKQPYTP